MKLNHVIVLLILLLGVTGCSTQRKLVREYKGKTKADLVLGMGKPVRIENGAGGNTVHIYIKNKLLKAAPINTGQFQYDKFESPKTVKTETYKFYLNSLGIIDDVVYDLSYAR